MHQHADPDRTVDEAPPDPQDAGLAAAFGPDSGPPLPAAGSVVQALGAAPVQLRAPDTEPADPVVKPRSDAVPADGPAGLQLHGEIARGGMGAVLKGRDTDLGRDVAVKVLLEAHAGRTELVQRFVEEAQIAGQLQHPGVVPVYEMGQLLDKRPYFTMKLVKGQTLSKLLAQRTDPAQDRPRFLGIFFQVCQALAYAHARGVIHRDLKPSNVMVGAFGEVQVMDWGLAKVLQLGGVADEKTPEPAEATVIRTARSGSGTPGQPGSQTQAGVVLGTPAYMAPEQARGEAARLDERCDVFGLGALLCQVLTSQPPYAGGDREEVYAKAARADLADAFGRLDACDADAELIALAQRCLAAAPGERPRDAGVLTAELSAYLGSMEARRRRAEMERAAAEARAVEERKRRRVQLGLAAAVLALVAVGAGGGLVVHQQAAERRADQTRRDAEQRQAVESALEKAVALRQQAHWGEAAAVLEQARGVLGAAGPDDLRQRLDVAQAELTLVNRLDAIRQRQATWVEGHFDTRTAAADYAAAFREACLGEIGDDEAVVAARVQASGVSGPLVAALDDWASIAKEPESRSWLLGVARRAGPDTWGDRFRDPAIWGDRQALQALAEDALRDNGAKLDELSPQVLASLRLRLRDSGADAMPLLRAAQRHYPSDFWLSLDLAHELHKANREEEALGYNRVAVALRPDACVAHTNLGVALYDKQDLDGAIAEHRKAIALDPNHAGAHTNLGVALYDKQDLDGAIAEHRKAIALDPNHAGAHTNLGVALYAKGDVAGAIAEYRQAIDLDPTFAPAHNNLGNALHAKKDVAGAIAAYCQAIVAYRQAIALDPKFARAHYNLGDALRGRGDLDGAIAAYRQAIDLDPKLARAHNGLGALLCDDKKDYDGAITAFRQAIDLDPTFAPAQYNLGNALHAKKDVAGAIAAYRKAIALDPKLAGAHNGLGNALRAKQDLAGAIAAYRRAIDSDPKYALAHYNLGVALYAKGDLDGAIAAFRQAIALEPKDALAHYNLGLALRAKGDLDGAIAEYRQAIDSDPKLARTHVGLGALLCDDKKDYDGAIAAFRQAITLDPKDALAHYNLGNALRGRGDLDGAIAAYRQAIDLDPKDALAHTNLGVALRAKGDMNGAIAEYRTAIALDPKLANAHCNLGLALRDKKDLDGAILAFRQAIALDPKLANAHYNLGLALRAKGDLDGAITEYRRAIDSDPKHANAHNSLGNALRDKGDVDGAIAEYRQAIALDPKDAIAHYNLGNALYVKKDVDGAIAEYRQAIEITPDYPEAHCNLGHALRDQGRFAEALEELRRGHTLGRQRPGWPYPSAEWVRGCERLVALDKKLPAVLNGDAEPADAAEGLELASLCGHYKRLHITACRLCADAFTADPKLAEDLGRVARYNAACYAALAAAGQGKEATLLPDKVIVMLRRQALAWLRADLAAYAKLAEGDAAAAKQAVRKPLEHWQQDSDLASVRDKPALAKLPDDEREAWRALWADVDALLRKVEEKK